ncbi:hypothetical protein B0H10DRAFT_1940206 [Mycena sp. CBHHK59/15]|nr:hypothetical protein B0H10DRAFT_1940206 [Mycena sp. CBHHK59/15]
MSGAGQENEYSRKAPPVQRVTIALGMTDYSPDVVDLQHDHDVLQSLGAAEHALTQPMLAGIQDRVNALKGLQAKEAIPAYAARLNESESGPALGLEQAVLHGMDAGGSDEHVPVKDPPLLYGMPLSGVKPVQPDFSEFFWEDSEFADRTGDENLPHIAQAPPGCQPTDGSTHPVAKDFELVEDRRYRRGCVYRNNFNTKDTLIIRRHLLCTQNPPGIAPEFSSEGIYIEKPIPGMLKAILGIPYIQQIDGNPTNTVTVAVAQTSASLEHFRTELAKQVQVLETELLTLVFGSNPQRPDLPPVPPLCRLGLKRNDRSSKPTPGSTDGSYSLGPTVEQGQGQGCFQPAVQTDTPAICEFHMTDNNVFVFGGLGPGATGCQYNSSAGKGNLAKMIGLLQGNWHADISDAWFFWTFGILMLKLPPGADPGPFMLGRSGIYFRETGILVLYLVFRGNDLHSGYAPSYDDKVHQEWIDKEAIYALIDLVDPQNRVFLVNYPNEVGNSRAVALSVTPPLGFMNQGAPVPHKLRQKNFAQHGQTILGTSHARSNRLGREIVWASLNAMQISGLELSIPSSDLFKLITYKDEENVTRALEPPPFSLDRDREYIIKMRGYFAWYLNQCEKYLIRITKDGYQTVQACLRLLRLERDDLFPVSERRNIGLIRAPGLATADYLITEVLNHQIVEGEVTWMVLVEGQTEPILFKSPNRGRIASFLISNTPLTSSILRAFYERIASGDVSVESVVQAVGNSTTDDPPSPSRPPYSGSVAGLRAITQSSALGHEHCATDHLGPATDLPRSDEAEAVPVPGPDEMRNTLETTPALAPFSLAQFYDLDTEDFNDYDDDSSGDDSSGDEDTSRLEPEDEEDVYKIAGIVGYENTEANGQRWCVRWKGFDSASDSWLTASGFRQADIGFAAFNARNGITVDQIPLFEPELSPESEPAADTPESSDDSYEWSGEEYLGTGKRKKGKRKAKLIAGKGESSAKHAPKKPKAPKAPRSIELPLKDVSEADVPMKAVANLFSSSNLQDELVMLENEQASVVLSRSRKVVGLSTLLNQLAQNDSNNNFIGSVLAFAEFNGKTACLSLVRLDSVVQLIPTFMNTQHQLSVISRSVQWEICRAMLIIYEWVMVTGPALADLLVSAHVNGTLDEYFPDFARLVKHIFLYVISEQNKPKKPSKKKRKLDDPPPEQDAVMDPVDSSDPTDSPHPISDPRLLQPALTESSPSATTEPLWPPKDLKLESLPADLYGLRTVRGSKTVCKSGTYSSGRNPVQLLLTINDG